MNKVLGPWLLSLQVPSVLGESGALASKALLGSVETLGPR